MERLEKIRRLAIFAVMMQHEEGLISKAPDYVEEKFHTAMNVAYPENGLDQESSRLYIDYMKKWILPLTDGKAFLGENLSKRSVLDE